jgi:vacuolar protein sorting-associated protein 13A/C
LKKFRASRSNVLSVITEHYKFELYREMRTIMGSAEAFGNPVGLINSVSVGVSDLFHEPLSAIREMQGPEDMALVADKTAKGAKSFFRNTAFGVFNSFSKLAATSAQTLTILAEDDAFLNERKDFHNKNRPAHFGDGVMVGAASFGRGVMSGLSGLVTKPVEGLEQEGLAGFAKGAVKGVGGFFLKPMAGFFDFAKSTADGVVSSTKDAALDSNQSRLPRMLYSHDRVIRVVNSEHSLLRWYLGQLESMPPNFSYCAHVYDQQNGLLVACSSDHLVAADTNLRRLSLLVPLWRVLGITTDLDHLVLSINVQVPPSDAASLSSARGTSRIDLELSSVAIVKAVQQLVGNAMEI